MVFRPYWTILGLTLFLPFEDFLLKWLPFSDRVYSLSRFGSEAVLLVTLAGVLVNRLLKGQPIRRTPIDALLACFIFLAFISVFLNNASVLRAIINLNVLVRYTAVYYIIVNLNITHAQTRRLIRIMLIIAVCESLLGLMQHFVGIGGLWIPRETDLEVAGFRKEFVILKTGIEMGAVMGTFSFSVALAFYLLLTSIMLLAMVLGPWALPRNKKVLIYAALALSSAGIVLTYSRISFFALIFSVPLILLFTGRKRTLMGLFIIFFFLTCVLLFMRFLTDRGVGTEFVRVKQDYANPLENIRMIFSKEFFVRKQSGRPWILTEVGGTVLKSGTLVGFSADDEIARRKIADYSKGMLQRLISFKTFEDVYWVAMLSYYGFLGIGLFLWILYRLHRCSRVVARNTKDYVFARIGLCMAVYIVLTIPLNFIIRPFENRIGSFYFWLLMGLVVSEYLRLKPQLMLQKRRYFWSVSRSVALSRTIEP